MAEHRASDPAAIKQPILSLRQRKSVKVSIAAADLTIGGHKDLYFGYFVVNEAACEVVMFLTRKQAQLCRSSRQQTVLFDLRPGRRV